MSKKISEFTLKNSISPNDVLAILDSEANYDNKKILASVISGGGGGGDLDYYHELTNVQMTFNNGDYQTSFITADCDGLTAYEEGIYVLKATSTNTGYSGYGVVLNINNLGNKICYLTAPYTNSSTHPLPKYFFANNYLYIFIYINGAFRCLYSYPVSDRQTVYDSLTTTTPIIELDDAVNMHSVHVYSSALTSLTLTNAPSKNQGFEIEIQFTTGATFTFTASGLVGKWIGGAPTFEPNKTYVIAIKNGLAAWGEVS